MVSATSAISGHGEIAYGNAIGSIICNTALIAAVTITAKPGKLDKKALIAPVSFFFVSAAFYATVAYTMGEFKRWCGILLLLIFVVYMLTTVLSMKKSRDDSPELHETPEEDEGKMSDEDYNALTGGRRILAHITGKRESVVREIVLLVIGAALIAYGADLLVDNGTIIAEKLGVPESVIALTFVALGTSLPELVTAITSLVKGHGSLSLGNVIGANLFNLVLVSGISVTLSPFSVPSSSIVFGQNASLVIDIPVMFTVMLLMTVPALIRGKLSRLQGILLLLIYAAFCTVQFAI